MEPEIRAASLTDLKDIQKLNQILCQKEHDEYDTNIISDWPFKEEGEAYFKKRIDEDDGHVLIALLNGKIIGYLSGGLTKIETYRKQQITAELENMFVIEEFRNSKIGTKLTKAFLDWCRSKAVERVKVSASFQNSKGVDFYKKCGFKEYSVILEKGL